MTLPEAPAEGCALCGATWGGCRETVEGVEWSFCCDACARFYALAVRRAREVTGWPRVDRLFLTEVKGTEAEGWARHGEDVILLHVEGTPDGSRLTEFRVKSPT